MEKINKNEMEFIVSEMELNNKNIGVINIKTNNFELLDKKHIQKIYTIIANAKVLKMVDINKFLIDKEYLLKI